MYRRVSASDRADDMLVNAINGGEVDCVISALEPPLQEDFIIQNRALLNTALWVGLGSEMFRCGRGTLQAERSVSSL